MFCQIKIIFIKNLFIYFCSYGFIETLLSFSYSEIKVELQYLQTFVNLHVKKIQFSKCLKSSYTFPSLHSVIFLKNRWQLEEEQDLKKKELQRSVLTHPARPISPPKPNNHPLVPLSSSTCTANITALHVALLMDGTSSDPSTLLYKNHPSC
jgi:hypothetical protein